MVVAIARPPARGQTQSWRPTMTKVGAVTGHVLSSLILTLISLAVVIPVALLVGYDSAASPLRWLAALGLLMLLAIALIWPSVAFGGPRKAWRPRATCPCS